MDVRSLHGGGRRDARSWVSDSPSPRDATITAEENEETIFMVRVDQQANNVFGREVGSDTSHVCSMAAVSCLRSADNTFKERIRHRGLPAR